MTEDEALFLAAVANPAETTLALALADWFDEHDEPSLATALRTVPELVPLLHSLKRWDEVPDWNLQVYESGALREAWDLLPAARLLVRYRHLFPTTPETPVTFDPAAPPPREYGDTFNTAGFLTRWLYERQQQVSALRESAAARAESWGRRGTVFGRVPKGFDPFEWKSCLVQELVLRGRDESAASIQRHVAAMLASGHPLGWLPLNRLPIEEEPPALGKSIAPGRALRGSVTEVTLPVSTSPAFAAVRNWKVESNGSLDAAELVLDHPVEARALGATWLRSLPTGTLAPVEGNRLTLARIATTAVFGELFTAARSGGFYNRGEYGAYARLHAWQSTGWLVGCPPTADVYLIANRAEQCEWFSFRSNWFIDIARDIGIICIRPDRRSVAMLAASDTD
ncbi:Uncharacterized protein OS=Streptomyces albus J1074 GN=SSHG_05305 PE=4 SV=1 [Gemmataceae bacterium]|nr:Uncharacterized protein OS=Streptomyces albus J1074 GN=SSHG_05305 PE=4 SV=1 [Gemmataceae bacterium]VTT96421.1 Uncharacterized protein OS=Streptomyces albus J1074 GN=SSHG_05305 PE=4 SV=1 [Gemmataceae bacterium]